MNREIKFRAWSEVDKRWIKIAGFRFQSGEMLPWEWRYQDDGPAKEWTFVDGFKLMQFTGLKDRNGKEIYEGDILEGHSDGLVRVEWAKDNGGWECIFKDEANIGIAEMCTWFGNKAIVIGNIFENPELIPQ